MIPRRSIFLLVSLPFLFACVGGRPLTETKSTKGKTGVFFHYDVRTKDKMINSSGCSLVLKQGEETFSIPMEKLSGVALVEAPAGKYTHQKLFCGATRQWETQELFPGTIQVYKDRVSYIGKFLFTIKVTNTDRNLNAQYVSRQEMEDALAASFQAMGDDLGSNLVSGFSGKAISKGAVTGENRRVFIGEIKDKLLDCEKIESKTNPIVLGRLSYELKYKKREIVTLSKTAEEHTYSDHFINCAETAMKAFQPATDAETLYKVSF